MRGRDREKQGERKRGRDGGAGERDRDRERQGEEERERERERGRERREREVGIERGRERERGKGKETNLSGIWLCSTSESPFSGSRWNHLGASRSVELSTSSAPMSAACPNSRNRFCSSLNWLSSELTTWSLLVSTRACPIVTAASLQWTHSCSHYSKGPSNLSTIEIMYVFAPC